MSSGRLVQRITQSLDWLARQAAREDHSPGHLKVGRKGEEDAYFHLRKIGYVIQEGGLFPHATVEQNVGVVPKLEGWPESRIRARTAELLEALGLPVSIYGSRYPSQLSGGEKQRAGIARALAADPPMLLLDEPFAALDPVTRFEAQQQFLELRSSFQKTALFVTHDIREALMLGSRIALLKNGEIDAVTSADEFTAARSAEAQAFLATLGGPEARCRAE